MDFSKWGPVEDVEMPRIKKISGPALHRSWLNVPHVTHNDEADITDLDKYRKEMDTMAKDEGYRVTLLSFVIKASVSALKQHWEVNSSIHPDGDKLIKKDYYNIRFRGRHPERAGGSRDQGRRPQGIGRDFQGIGRSVGQGPRGRAERPGHAGRDLHDLVAGRHRRHQLHAHRERPRGGHPGLTRSKMAPVWNGEEFVPRLMQPLSLSYDHRAIDGALAARFCVTLKTLLSDMRKLMW